MREFKDSVTGKDKEHEEIESVKADGRQAGARRRPHHRRASSQS